MSQDRRTNHWIRDLIIPLIVAVIVGVSASVVTVRISVAVISSEMLGLKEDILDLKLVLGVVQKNQIAKTRLEIITADNREEIAKLIAEIKSVRDITYTKKDAEKDIEMLRLEARARHRESID